MRSCSAGMLLGSNVFLGATPMTHSGRKTLGPSDTGLSVCGLLQCAQWITSVLLQRAPLHSFGGWVVFIVSVYPTSLPGHQVRSTWWNLTHWATSRLSTVLCLLLPFAAKRSSLSPSPLCQRCLPQWSVRKKAIESKRFRPPCWWQPPFAFCTFEWES